MSAVRRLAIPALALAIAVTATVGVAYASTKGSGAKACTSSKGYLRLAGKTGHCPKHTREVTLGKRGPRGPQGAEGNQGPRGVTGASGPSNGYVSTTRDTPASPVYHTTVASLDLPAGSYSLIGAVNAYTTYEAPGAQIVCQLESGGKSTIAYQENLPAAFTAGGVVPGEAAVTVPGSLTLTAPGTVALTCSGTSGDTAVGTLQAVKVATLSSTGDSSFE